MGHARELYAQAAEEKWLEPTGVSVHIGSQITDVKPFAATMERVADLAQELRADGHDIRYIDAGGGLGISYRDDVEPFAARAMRYAEAVTRPLKGLKNVSLLLEPGRAIIGPCGVLLTRVLFEKRNGKKNFIVVDAGMTELMRPSLYNAYHEIVPVRAEGLDRRTQVTADVVGPVCESGDFFGRDREMSQVRQGELLAVLDAGAYGMALASNYNSRLRPAEVLVEGRNAKVIRRRETMRDLLRNED
jgi:diaminopimelate decarboxylase